MLKFFIEPGYSVKNPEREFGNAGIDFYIPKYSEAFEKAFMAKNSNKLAVLDTDSVEKSIIITPHGRANIPSGIRCWIDDTVALEAQNKSGIATNLGLVYGASTIDASYKGIIHISVINTTDQPVVLPLGTKIMQFIPRVIDNSDMEVFNGISVEEFYKDFPFSNRGEGAFGSTGIK